MKRSPPRERRTHKRPNKHAETLDRIDSEIDEVHVTAQPADEDVKMYLETGCSRIMPQFPEDK